MAGGERNVISLLREQLKTVHEILEGTMADVTPEQAHWTTGRSAADRGDLRPRDRLGRRRRERDVPGGRPLVRRRLGGEDGA